MVKILSVIGALFLVCLPMAASAEPYIDGSGTLILSHSYCGSYLPNMGTGAYVAVCDEWVTTVEVPAIKALRIEAAYTLQFAMVLAVRWLLILCGAALLGRWLFRILTHYRPLILRRRR